MNYYDARQRQGSGHWDFTCRNDNQVWPIGYCGQNHQAGTPCEHTTQEAARSCYKRYLLEEKLVLDGGTFIPEQDCQVDECENKTGVWTKAGQYYKFLLCDDHRTYEVVEKLLEVGVFYGSY